MNRQVASNYPIFEKICDWIYSCRLEDARWYVGLFLSIGVSIFLPIILFLFKQL
ncbi:hypothetical protein [Atopobacter phocae]|uniref:hypothetical protein n=1 Tax=Atopobacter phocae TaxID=136492 RepID=UPI0012EBB6FB|nr:hypothetical protein [Atopobacter phocae]